MIDNYIEELTKSITDDLIQKQEQMLLQRLKDLDLLSELYKEPKRRFKKFVRVSTLEETRYYYNDGTEEGLLICGYRTNMKVEGLEAKCNIEFFWHDSK